MAQGFVLKIGMAVERVHQLTVFGLCHGVDGEVAAFEVFFEGNVRRAVHGKTVVAAALFALSAGQGIFLAGFRVQEHREVGTHLLEAPRLHLLRCGANHHPVPVFDLQAQQLVTNGAAYQIGLHGKPCV